MFEEATRIPLLIAHPQSPFKGQHYSPPVESVDVYATLNELLRLPKKREDACQGFTCRPLDGKSLVPVVLGTAAVAAPADAPVAAATVTQVKSATTPAASRSLRGVPVRELSSKKPSSSKTGKNGKSRPLLTILPSGAVEMAKFAHDFAISQVIRCAPRDRIPNPQTAPHRHHVQLENKEPGQAPAARSAIWNDCETRKPNPNEVSLLGYSMRTQEYRYTAYYPYNRTTQRPELSGGLSTVPYEEELFDHKNETLADFTHREIVNLAYRPGYAIVIAHYRTKLAEFVVKAFSNPSPHRNQ